MSTWWIDDAAPEYRSELIKLAERYPWPLERMDKDDVLESARRGAQATVAPLVWAEMVGEKLDTGRVTLLLGVTRQAVNQRVASGRLLGVPGRGTTWFPTWQFDTCKQPARVRPVVPELLKVWRDALGNRYDPLVIIGWAHIADRADLGGASPIEWMEKSAPDQPLLLAARRSAAAVPQ